jgi:asparagine synthase (glutamine-hydrolysing)
MSGISGIVTPRGSGTPGMAERVRQMQDRMRHRGHGAVKVWSSPDVALGYQPTSITEPGRAGTAVPDADGRCRIVLDGQIQVPASVDFGPAGIGDDRRGSTSPESLLRLFLSAGVPGLAEVRGVFAFAVWQGKDRRVTLVRDPLGIKPLHYVHATDGSLYFASEPKALLAADAVRPALDYAALPSFLASHGGSGEATLFEGIRRVPPGHALIWQEGQVRLESYWSLEFGGGNGEATEAELAERFAVLLREASRFRLRSGSPAGAVLSGSLGSAAMVGILSDLAGPGVRTYSVAFAGEPTEDRDLARLAARAHGTDHVELVLSAREFFASLPSVIWHLDAPVAEPATLQLFYAALHASEQVQALWSAGGCDELLASHQRYREALTAARMARRVHAGLSLFGMRDVVRRTGEAMGRRSRLAHRIARRLPHAGIDIRKLYLDELAAFGAAEQSDLLTDEACDRGANLDPYDGILQSLEAVPADGALDQILATGLRVWLPDAATIHDRMGAAVSIETHAPFLDHELVRFAAGLPARMKLGGRTSQPTLRHGLARRLPPEIVQRWGSAPPVPVGRWLRGAFRPLLHEYVLSNRALGRGILRADAVGHLLAEHESGRADHARQLWALINLELWQRLYVDGDAVTLDEPHATAVGG